MSILSLVRVWVLLLIGLLLVPTPSLGAPAGGSVTTAWPIDLFGMANISAAAGAALVHPSRDLGGTRLQAESLTIDFRWERGIEVKEGVAIFQQVVDDGRDRVELRDADVRFARAHGEPVVFPFNDGRAMDLSLSTPSGFALAAAQSQSILKVGSSPDAVGSRGDRTASFWYSVDASQVEAVGAGTLQVYGDFSLFVHQVAIHAEDDRRSWSEWTGYRQEDPSAAVTEYELRVTTIHVTNGSLVSPSAERAALYADWLDGTIDGTVSSFGVTGEIQQEETAHRYEGEMLRLHGAGSIRARTVGVSEDGPDGRDSSAAVRIDLRGAFRSNGAAQGDGLSARSSVPAPAFAVASAGTFGLLTVGLMVLGILPGPTPASRRRRHRRWLQNGGTAMDEGDFDGAATCFRRATRLKRDEPLAWFKWAQAELEAGRPDAADEVACQAMQIPGADRWDLIDLRASAAWTRGDLAAFQALLAELARAAPAMAQGLVADLGVDQALLRSDVRRLLGAPEPGGGVDGYV